MGHADRVAPPRVSASGARLGPVGGARGRESRREWIHPSSLYALNKTFLAENRRNPALPVRPNFFSFPCDRWTLSSTSQQVF
jgi:hypothetical protein